jgi:hypothetical protein
MEFRQLTKSGVKVSVISFGGMRIPDISEEQAYLVVNRALDLGINYFETAYGYGDSEIKIGKSLGKRRKEIYLSTKNGYNSPMTGDEVKKSVDEQLKRLKTDYLDFYQMWGTDSIELLGKITAPGNKYEAVKQLMKEGVIKHVGMTTHATPEDAEKILETGLFECVTIYYNAYKQSFAKVAALANKLGIGVVAMGPLNGGFLGSESKELSFLIRGKAKTNAEGALRFNVGNPNITTSIVGFKTVKEVEAGVRVGDFYSDIANTNDMAEITEGFKAMAKKIPETVCSSCNYCMACKEKITIPHIFSLVNNAKVYGSLDFSKAQYNALKIRADACSKCGTCMEKCPQKIDVIKDLAAAHEMLN